MNAEGHHILVVDDSAAQRRFLDIMLTLDGHRVTCLEDGLEAMTYLQSGSPPPDLMIVDVDMPYMSGLELCETLRGFSSLPVIVLTSMNDEATQRLARLAQADAFVTKPLLGQGFRKLVGDMLRGYRPQSA